jgi:hypothetical protein
MSVLEKSRSAPAARAQPKAERVKESPAEGGARQRKPSRRRSAPKKAQPKAERVKESAAEGGASKKAQRSEARQKERAAEGGAPEKQRAAMPEGLAPRKAHPHWR